MRPGWTPKDASKPFSEGCKYHQVLVALKALGTGSLHDIRRVVGMDATNASTRLSSLKKVGAVVVVESIPNGSRGRALNVYRVADHVSL